MSDQIFWYATRGAGILAWFSATLSLAVGLLLSSRVLGRRPTIPWLLDTHRFFGAMSMVFLGLHLFTLWADSFVTLTVADLLVPGRAVIPGLSRMSMAWGALAAWLLVVIEASSYIRQYLPARFWHTLHLGSFGVVIMGLIHAIQTGSDADNRILMTAAVSLLAAVVLLTATRLSWVLSDRKHAYEVSSDDDDDDETAADLSWQRSTDDLHTLPGQVHGSLLQSHDLTHDDSVNPWPAPARSGAWDSPEAEWDDADDEWDVEFDDRHYDGQRYDSQHYDDQYYEDHR